MAPPSVCLIVETGRSFANTTSHLQPQANRCALGLSHRTKCALAQVEENPNRSDHPLRPRAD